MIPDEILKPLMDLVAIPTIRRNTEAYEEAVGYLEELISTHLPEASLETISVPSRYGGRERVVKNLVAFVDAKAEKTVAIVTHYDVVEARGPRVLDLGDSRIEFDPFKPTLVGDRLYGRGSADDKSNVIASIFATKRALGNLRKNVLLVITGDEEIGGEAGIDSEPVRSRVIDLADEVIVLDGMYGFVAHGASGVIHAKVRVRGDQGHAGLPHKFRNAVHALVEILHRVLVRNPFGGYSEAPARGDFRYIPDRLTITGLSAGLGSPNVIPPVAEATVDFRYVTESPEAAEDMLERIFVSAAIGLGLTGIEFEVLGNHPSRYIPPEHPFVSEFKEVADSVTGEPHGLGVERGGNDGFIFARRGVPTITYGTMTEDSNIHAPLENVRLDVVARVMDVLEAYLTRRCVWPSASRGGSARRLAAPGNTYT